MFNKEDEQTASITLAGTHKPVEYAGFARRSFALAFDQVIILGLQWSFFSPAILAIFYNESLGWALTAVVAFVTTLMQYWIYTACFEHSRWQATPGKFLVGLKVTDLEGNQLSFWRSSLRLLIQYVLLIVMTLGFTWLMDVAIGYSNARFKTDFSLDRNPIPYIVAVYVGYCFVLFTKKKQTLFDKAARRVVVFQPNYANSQQMTTFECFKASFLKLPQQAKLFFSHFSFKTKFEKIRMSMVALFCLVAWGWSVFAMVQVTESLVAVENAIKDATIEKEKPKTAIKKMEVLYLSLEALAHRFHLTKLEEVIQDRSLMYSENLFTRLRRFDRKLAEKNIVAAEKELMAATKYFKRVDSAKTSSDILAARARFELAKGNGSAAKELAVEALKWNPYQPKALETLSQADTTSGRKYLKLNEIEPVSVYSKWNRGHRPDSLETPYLSEEPELLEKKLKECNQILEIMPDCTSALLTKAATLEYLHRPKDALALYPAAMASAPESLQPLKDYVSYLSDSDNIETKVGLKKLEALAKTHDLAFIHGACADQLVEYATLSEDENEKKELRQAAIVEWDKAIKLEPDRIKLYVDKGRQLTFEDKYKEAIKEFKIALTKDFSANNEDSVEEADVRKNLAEAYGKIGAVDQADKEYSLILAKNPTNDSVAESRAEMLTDHKRYMEALPLINSAIEQKKKKSSDYFLSNLTTTLYLRIFGPKSTSDNKYSMGSLYASDVARLIAKRGETYEALKDYEHALADYQECLSMDETYSSDNAAHLCCKIGKPEKAVEIYSAAISKTPDRPQLYLVQSVLLQHIGKKQEAEKAKQRCIEKYRKQIEKDSDGTNQFLLAKAYLAFHDYSKAESSIKKALELEPDEGSYKMTLAKIYAKQNKFAEAQKLSDSVPMSNCSCTYENKAEILQASGQYDKSLSLLDKGIADDSKSVNCYYLRSIAYKHKGMNDKATADMKKAKELGYYSDPLLRLDI